MEPPIVWLHRFFLYVISHFFILYRYLITPNSSEDVRVHGGGGMNKIFHGICSPNHEK